MSITDDNELEKKHSVTQYTEAEKSRKSEQLERPPETHFDTVSARKQRAIEEARNGRGSH